MTVLEENQNEIETPQAVLPPQPTAPLDPIAAAVHQYATEMVPAIPQKFVVQLKGLPFSATPMEIVSFLAVDPHSVKEVELTKSNTGKPSGDCFVVVADEMTQEECLKMHKEIFGDTGRYAEVYKATEEFYMKRLKITQQFDNAWDGTVRLRGLPFKERFFSKI